MPSDSDWVSGGLAGLLPSLDEHWQKGRSDWAELAGYINVRPEDIVSFERIGAEWEPSPEYGPDTRVIGLGEMTAEERAIIAPILNEGGASLYIVKKGR